MVTTDVATFCAEPPNVSRAGATSSFVAWFRHSTRSWRASSASPVQESVNPTTETVTPQQAFNLWGMAVWRSIKLRGVRERDVEDVLQDVFIIVLNRWDSFRGDSSRKTWVFGIVHGVVANYHRKNRRAAAEPALVGPEFLSGLSTPPGHDPVSRSTARQELEWLSNFLAGLREEDRALFVLRHIDGCTVSEAASIIGMTPSLANGRLLAVEKAVNLALSRHEARDAWRLK